MSLPGKTMKIGGYNYHVSDQGEGDKVAFLVHGMPDDGREPLKIAHFLGQFSLSQPWSLPDASARIL